ncbi:hypothetical protein LTR56_011828 [Elasticomyces elasticus]|nr:hypothetical protein LTR56_011828 [Elasticomyces elasticus]KAK3666443.1 hypothetical protein LTR22_002748 [Elasticomyces elasticus]KAK4931263.1 hypothetical protein LTR49_002321 [Elasticomyces elasticus]KAK5767806.1 hypothetical protein LTS12_001958 [Elasticomyces elasticus]
MVDDGSHWASELEPPVKYKRRLPPHTRAPRNTPEPRPTESTGPPPNSPNVTQSAKNSVDDEVCSHCGKTRDEPPAEEDLDEDKYHNPKWWIVTDTPEDLAREQCELEEGAGWLKEAYRIAERKVVVKQPEETEEPPMEIKEGTDHEDFWTTVPSGDDLAATAGPCQAVSFAEASTLLRTPVSSWSTSLTTAQEELSRDETSLREMGFKVLSQMEAKKQQLLDREKQLKDLAQRMGRTDLQSDATPSESDSDLATVGGASPRTSSNAGSTSSDTDVSPARSAEPAASVGVESDSPGNDDYKETRQH